MRKLIFILIALISFSQAQTIQYIGAPTTTVISRGNFKTDSIFYLPKRTKTPTDTAAFRYQISDSSLYYWTGYQWTKVQSASSFASVDTTVISTRAYRQKGDDSLGAIIATKGSGTVTSVATGYGLSGGTITTTGTLIADTLNLSTRAWRQKGLDSLAALEISGSGTTNYIPKFTASRNIGNSLIFDEGTNVGINTTSPGARLDVFSSGYNFIRSTGGNGGYFESYNSVGTRLASYGAESNGDAYFGTRGNNPSYLISNGSIRLTATGAGEILINTTTDAGAYTLQNNGALYNTGSATIGSTIINNNAPFITGSNIYAGANMAIGTNTANSFSFFTNNTERMRINSDGDLFIRGTYNPVSSTNRGNITLNGTASNIIAFANNSALRGYIFHTDSDFLFYNNTTGGRVGLYTEGNARLWITAGGNIGIGTTSPSTFLGSSGSMTIQGAIPGLLLSESGNLSGFFASNTTQLVIDARPTRDMDFQTNGTRRLRISNDGELLINTITDAGNYRVQVSGNAYVTGDAILAASSGNVGIGTTSPETKLTIVDGSGYRMAIRQWSATGMEINAWDNAFQPTIPLKLNANYLSFYSGSPSSERIKIHSNGGLKYVPQSAAPTAEAGTVYYDSDDNKLKVYNGTTWVDLH